MSNKEKAFEGIKKASGTTHGEEGINLFISHHTEELPKSYWRRHLGTESPSTDQVIEMLVLRWKWDDDEVYNFLEHPHEYYLEQALPHIRNLENILTRLP